MFRSCLFFYDLSTANVKEKREHFNRRVIRSWYDYVAMAPFVSARWRKSNACAHSMASAQASRQRTCYLPRPGPSTRHRGSRHRLHLLPHNKDRFFCIFRFVAHMLIIPLPPRKWSNSKTCIVPLQSEGPSMSLNASRDLKQLTQDLVRTNSVAVPPGGDETSAQRVLQSFFREHGVRGDVCQGIY